MKDAAPERGSIGYGRQWLQRCRAYGAPAAGEEWDRWNLSLPEKDYGRFKTLYGRASIKATRPSKSVVNTR